jgi:O-antigen ligase
MTSAYPMPVAPPFAGARAVTSTFDKNVLGQIAFAVVPAMAAVAAGRPSAGAYYLLGVLFSLLVYHFVTRTPAAATAVMIGTLPAWMLLRNYFFYNSIEIVLALCVLAWMEGGRSDLRAVWRDGLVRAFFAFFAIYWLLSWAITGDYAREMRSFELVFSALNIYLLGKHRRLLGTAFIGVALSVIAIGLGLLPYGDRLGMANVDGSRLGNPISFGIPAALVLLLSIADGGRWLMLRDHPNLRIAINAITGLLLVLSTSRGSWLVLLVGGFVILCTDRKHRKTLLLSAVGLCLVVGLWMKVEPSQTLQHYLEKTFSPEESWSKRTTGRAEQWAAFPKVIADSPAYGFGPGNGRRISVLYAHKNIIWHSIYLQFGAETGLIGLGLLAILLVAFIHRAWTHYARVREAMPLIGILGFLTIGISVPALDGLSGMFLGLALIGCDFSRFWVVRRSTVAAQQAPSM